MNPRSVIRAAVVAAAFTVGCQHQQASTLPAQNQVAQPAPAAAPAAPAPRTAPAARPAAAIDRSGTVEERLARLEEAYARSAEALEFLNKVYDSQKAQKDALERDELADDGMFAVDIADDVRAGQVEGSANAAVTIVKAFDFACPYCQRATETLAELLKAYPGKLRIVYVNMVIHPQARPAHLASCAAAKQGKYKQFKDAFWDKGYRPYAASQGKDQSPLEDDNILAIAADLGLDTKRLKTDMASRECEARLDHDAGELAKFHVNSTPTFFINGKHLSGAQPKEAFVAVIDEQLAIVARSGVPAAQYYTKVVLAKGEKQFRSKLDPRPDN